MAANIKEILDELPAESYKALMYSFEHGLTYHVEYKDSRFIGVNVENVPYLKADTQVGFWSVGRIAK